MIMSMKEIADKADVIIDGFAILKKDNDQYAVVNINRPGHSTVFKKDGSIIESSMDDIEINIAQKYLGQALKYMMEEQNAGVL